MSKKNKPYAEDIDVNDISAYEEEKIAENENIEAEEVFEEPIIEETEVASTTPVLKEDKKVDVNEFIARKLKVINEIGDEAKANAYASRILRNK